MTLERFVELWCSKASFELWQMLLIGLFFLVANSVMFFTVWYVRINIIESCGYPKVKSKKAKKHQKLFNSYTLMDRLLLIKLVKGSKSKLSYINFVCHCITSLGYFASILGAIWSMITLADGWAMMLMIGGEFFAVMLTLFADLLPKFITNLAGDPPNS